jgi:hypothetical protein
MGKIDFVNKWAGVLSSIDNSASYKSKVSNGGRDGLPTQNLPNEASIEIKRLEKELTGDCVLVLSRPYEDSIDPFTGNPIIRNGYFNAHDLAIEKLINSGIPNIVLYTSPELFVHKHELLESGKISSVVLTPFNSGECFYEGDHEKIGNGKTVYIAASGIGRLVATAWPLINNNNDVIVLADSSLYGYGDFDRFGTINRAHSLNEELKERKLPVRNFIDNSQLIEKFKLKK